MKVKVYREENEPSKEYYNRRTRERKKYGKAILRRFKIYKGCAKCGYNEHHAGLEFNHVIPQSKREDKSFNIGHHAHYLAMSNGSKSRDKLKNELKQCEVLCRNCHGIVTFEEKHWRNSTNVTR